MQLEPGVGKRIAKEAMRGEDGDMMGALNPLDLMFFRGARVNLQVPIVDPVVTRQCLIFLINELPGLVAAMDRLPDRRQRSLLAETTLKRWNWAFKKKVKP